jgi:hypothetical protein
LKIIHEIIAIATASAMYALFENTILKGINAKRCQCKMPRSYYFFSYS